MNKLNAAFVFAVAFSLTASAESYLYTPGDTSLGNGAVTITYEDGTTDIATLAANPANGETITLTGGAATFAAGATLTLASSGTVSFAEKVTTKGALTLVRGDDAYKVWTSSTALAESDPGVCAFPDIVTNATVSAADINNTWECIHVVAGIPSSSSNSRNHLNVGGRFDSIGGKIGSGEFVSLNRVADSFVYSIRVQLSPRANGLYARCRTGVRSPRFGIYPNQEASWVKKSLWASWPKSDTNWGYYGFDTDINSVGGTWLARISDMGLNRIILKRKSVVGGPMKVRFDGGVTLGGTTTVPYGMEAVVAVDSYGSTTVSNTINGEGDLTFVPLATTFTPGTAYMDGFIYQSEWRTLAENRSLATMTNIVGYIQGGGHNAGQTPSLCKTYHLRYNTDDGTVTCQFQFQRSPDGIKYVQAKFRQNGANVEVQAVGAGYAAGSTAMGTEFTSWNTAVSTLVDESLGYGDKDNYTGGYGIRQITATFGSEPTYVSATVSGDIKTLYGSKVSFTGTDNVKMHATITALTGLPAGGEAHVRDGSLALKAGSDSPGGGSTRIFVHSGAELRNINTWQIGTFQDIVLDGGTYNGYSTTLYVNHVILSNAVMKGTYPRAVNNNVSQHWRVIGDEPSVIGFNGGNGVNVYGVSSAASARSSNRAFRMDVMDVTGDSAVDCTLSGIRGAADRGASDRESYTWFYFEKLGSGTLKITGDSRELRLESKLYNGTLLLAGNNIMTNEVQLLGGNLAIDAGKHNDNFGQLTASKPGTITVGEGGSLSFASFTASTNATLTVGEGGSLTFASFTPGAGLVKGAVLIDAPLTANTLKFNVDVNRGYFRWKDGDERYHVRQDAEGYLHPVRSSSISIR